MIPNAETAARELIESHRDQAVLVAIDRLNDSIDQGDRRSRDFWAQVVHLIHDHQRADHTRLG